MNISKTDYSQSFGKQALMTCTVRENAGNKPKNATLYKLDPDNKSDRMDVNYSKYAYNIARDFNNAHKELYPKKEFFMLQNDETGEVISCAETSHRYRPVEFSHPGQYTLIEEAQENKKYNNGIEPLFAYVTKKASDKCDENIFTAFNEDSLPGIEKSEFLKTEQGAYFVPEERFHPVLMQDEKKYNIEYLA